MVNETDVFQLVGNFGFPIVITIYLLHRFEKKIENLEHVIQDLAKAVSLNNRKTK